MGELSLHHVRVDLTRREVHAADGSVTGLTPNEHRLLGLLVARANQVVPRKVLLEEGLGYRASLSTRALSHAILRLRQKLEADPAAPVHLKTVYGVGYRLDLPPGAATQAGPPSPSPGPGLLGRRADAAGLRAALAAPGCLVTVVGPAGVGKTTLARHLLGGEPDGLFVDLSRAAGADEVASALAGALGISQRKGQVRRSLRARGPILVVLDNTEQLGAAAVSWLGAAREGCAARLLATSRRPLGLDGEARVALAPLGEEDGVALLRAQAPWLAGQADDGLGALVRRLDGLPLAIELAAARCRMLSPAQLLARLDARRDLLRRRRQDLREQRVSMFAALESSWELLDEEEADVLIAAARFAGPLTAADVEALLPGGEPLLPLEALAEHSLLSVTPGGTLRMLLTVRDFVRSRTPPDLAAALDARLAEAVLSAAAAHAAGLHRGRWAEGMAGLRRLEPELRALWARRAAHPAEAARAALALDALWMYQASLRVHRALLDDAAALPGLDAEQSARLCVARALLSVENGAPQEALDLLAAMPAGAEPSTGLVARRLRAVALLKQGRLAEARAALDDALGAAGGDRWHEAMLLTTASRVELAAGALDAAERTALRALPLLRQTGHRFGEANVHERLGRVLTARGELASALDAYAQEQAAWEELGVRAGIASSLISQASVRLHRLSPTDEPLPTFAPAEAARGLARARALLQQEGWAALEHFVVVNQLRAALLLDQPEQAAEHHRALADLLLQEGHPALLDWLAPLLGSIVSARTNNPAQAASRARQGLLLAEGHHALDSLRSALAGQRPGKQPLSVAARALYELTAPR